MKTQHTPGPWETDHSGKSIQIYSSIGTLVVDKIARRERVTTDLDEGKFSLIEQANAKLIAAAPDLLKALKNIASRNCNEDSDADDLFTIIENHINDALDAIQKAEL